MSVMDWLGAAKLTALLLAENKVGGRYISAVKLKGPLHGFEIRGACPGNEGMKEVYEHHSTHSTCHEKPSHP